MILTKWEDARSWKRKHLITPSGKLTLYEAMDLLLRQDYIMMVFQGRPKERRFNFSTHFLFLVNKNTY
jgi:hypothetical protein